MALVTSERLQQFLENEKRKSEGLLPELIKRLILSSCSNIDRIRIPGEDDVWAPGFDGIVDCQERTTYVSEGTSVWEFGTNKNSLQKINKDYQKRTDNPLGIDKATTAFYLVIPYIWAYDNKGMSLSQWVYERKDDWKEVHVYDASDLCNWIESEPAVCAWLFEQYGETQHLSFSSVSNAWYTFSNKTSPPLSNSFFLEGRQDFISDYLEKIQQKMCRVRASSFVDAYGFCLSALMQDKDTMNRTIVVNDENTYAEFKRTLTGKTFLLSFPFSSQVSDFNSTILCYSKESTSYSNMIVLPDLWKTQYTKALRDMGMSDAEADECYLFTHGNLLSLIRRIPGNSADAIPRWANSPDVHLLYPIVFLRQFSTSSKLGKQVITSIANTDFETIEQKYESFIRMEDSPIKKVDDSYYLVNYEEAWLTLKINIHDSMSTKFYETVIALLSECKDKNDYTMHSLAAIIEHLLYNYIYFNTTGSDPALISSHIRSFLEFLKYPSCKGIILKSLPILAEASPVEVMSFIENESGQSIVYQVFNETDKWSDAYCNVLWALEKLVEKKETSTRSCLLLYKLCQISREYHINNTPRETLLTSLCLWSDYTALTITEKKDLVKKIIDDDCEFGVPFAIDLIAKNSAIRGVRIGAKKQKHESVTTGDLLLTYGELTSIIIHKAIAKKRIDWLKKVFGIYWYIPSDVLDNAAELLASIDLCSEQIMPLIFQLKSIVYQLAKQKNTDCSQWVDAMNKCADCLFTDDPISREGWRFFKYYETPFLELQDDTGSEFWEKQEEAKQIREGVIAIIREKYGISTIIRLVNCMEDDCKWGAFLGDNLTDEECDLVVKSIDFHEKEKLIAGIIDCVDLHVAAEIYNSYSFEYKKLILPLLGRKDIDSWLDTPELEQLYWQTKSIIEYDERAYHNLLKYNPCGILRMFHNKTNDSNAFNLLIEVVRAIIVQKNCTDYGLLKYYVQQFDEVFYTDEWAELCLELFEKSIFNGFYSFYPNCLKTYFYKHPERIIERFHIDPVSSTKHFDYYSLPKIAFENQDGFMMWADYMYKMAIENSFITTLGSIFGRSGNGKDDIFPHEFVRIALEKYSNAELTSSVAWGWIRTRGARTVTDGFYETKVADLFRGYARSMELDFPQTAKVLLIIADDYSSESKMDRHYAEAFPV